MSSAKTSSPASTNLRSRIGWYVLSVASLCLSCSGSSGTPEPTPTGTGGTVSSVGGSSAAGGVLGKGGASSLGGSIATGGNSTTGGSANSGGTSNGGAVTGGASSGGASMGGASIIGGTSNGGAVIGGASSGGAFTGGTATGGKAAGGTTGGVSTGGVATGGKATGGASVGGAATGGKATGGTATGGAATGGAAAGGTTNGCSTAMRNITSMELVKDMGLGWNLGNSMDATGVGAGSETAWGNPLTTLAMIQAVATAGFKSIRIPVTWNGHFGAAPSYVIDAAWLNRVQQIVDWTLGAGMYAIINMHHDGGWIEGASTDPTSVIAKYKALWAQIVPRYSCYSDKLVFESMNEVGFDDMAFTAAVARLNQLNGEFATQVRGSGGNNAQRHLLIAGYWTDTTRSQGVLMPDSRCILSVHYYTPSSFTFGGTTWGSASEVAAVKTEWANVKTNYIDKGIPIILGEYGVVTSTDAASRIFWLETVTKLACDMGASPYLWDDGGGMGSLNRNARTWPAGLLDALKRGCSGTVYTPMKL